VPAISYLKCTGCATSRSVGIHTTTVAADDLNIGMLMLAEPVDEGVSRGILQQVDDAVSSGIHQNRAVAASSAKRKFVNSEHLWRLDGLLRERPYQTHQRGAARRHRQTRAVPTPRTTAEGKADGLKHRPEPERSMRVPLGQCARLFDEGLARALWLITAKAAHP